MKPRTNTFPPVNMDVLLLDVKQVASICNLGVSTVWKLAKSNPDFPKPKYFGPRTARWVASSVKQWAENLE